MTEEKIDNGNGKGTRNEEKKESNPNSTSIPNSLHATKRREKSIVTLLQALDASTTTAAATATAATNAELKENTERILQGMSELKQLVHDEACSLEPEYLVMNIGIPATRGIEQRLSNAEIAECGLDLLADMLRKKDPDGEPQSQQEQQRLTYLRTQLGETSCPVLLQVLAQHKTATLQLKSLHALVQLSLVHAQNQQLIIHHRLLPNILDCMKWHAFNAELQICALSLLANLAQSPPESKQILVSKGVLDCILTAMQDHVEDTYIQTAACRALANLSYKSSEATKRKMSTACIRKILVPMRLYPHTHLIQLFCTCILRNLSQLHHDIIIQQGGMGTLVVAMRENMDSPQVQEQATAALFNLLKRGIGDNTDDVLSLCAEGGHKLLLEILANYPTHLTIQHQGLGALTYLATPRIKLQDFLVSNKAIDIVIAALKRYPTNLNIAIPSVDIVANLSHNRDLQPMIVIKNGMKHVIGAMKQHLVSPIVQHMGCCMLRNLCWNREQLRKIAKAGGINVLMKAMQEYPEHAALQAYACDALGLLATNPANQVAISQTDQKLAPVLNAMKHHPNHVGVQGRACIFLKNMASFEHMLTWMKKTGKEDYDLIALLKGAEKVLLGKQKQPATDLLNRLQWSRIFMKTISGN